MTVKNLADKILADKIASFIEFSNKKSSKFDPKIDHVFFSLSPKQFKIIKIANNLHVTQVLCQNLVIDKFTFGDYEIKVSYNSRLGTYEMMAWHADYIMDFDLRADYIDDIYYQ